MFELIRRQRTSADALHCAFDFLELDGEDLRRAPIESCRARLAELLATAPSAIVFNEAFEGDGPIIYKWGILQSVQGMLFFYSENFWRGGKP